MSNSVWPHGLYLPGSSVHGIFQARVLEHYSLGRCKEEINNSKGQHSQWMLGLVTGHSIDMKWWPSKLLSRHKQGKQEEIIAATTAGIKISKIICPGLLWTRLIYAYHHGIIAILIWTLNCRVIIFKGAYLWWTFHWKDLLELFWTLMKRILYLFKSSYI